MTSAPSLPATPAFELLGEEVEISRIEKALQALFAGGSDADHDGIARASLINLALYNENPAELEQDAAVLAELTSETACRSLLIHADTRAAVTGARAWVQAHCQIDRNGAKSVCTEQISFFLTGHSSGLLRNAVLAHLDSDLPLAFWWRGEFSDAFEEGLYSRIDRLLFDSEGWASPRNPFLRLLECQRGTSSPYVMHDLAFTRMNSIRHAIANAFDRPLVARELGSLSEVTIRYANGFRMSALYLAAWTAARLETGIDAGISTSREIVCLPCKGLRKGFRIRLAELDPARLGTVEVDFEMGGTRVEISRCQTRDFIRTLTKRENADTQEDWLPARRMHDAALVADILNRAGRNRTHGQILPVVLELLALRG
jgi:glucose-6-phosphate dehydrogenase assembly protein OpcA